ncbi:SET domain-containing protein [Cucurbitaria berberidis CBS 394.84]|uniref:SET domain-containing protein n=1 Tax=Cucurbitaria berberidis CBS 394.84 TaxID=1168544 RepID=A0A9P4LA79_9PLEO|nr:SET domain-containing protein [Cucurbitaria berberidis CBS 394.84]KAF1848106.1 SET domain-containing protein [Cucurbitaria berberidis CBS 394.84]
MSTQNQVFKAIQSRRNNSKTPSRREVNTLLKQIYDPELDGPLHFYSQDKNGLPVAKISTTVADWQGQKKPSGFKGTRWPPLRVEDLVGNPDLLEVCVNHEENIRKCRCSHQTWAAKMFKFWLENILLRDAEDKGCGAFARNAIPANTPIGEFTGKIIPRNEDAEDDAEQYHSGIAIGDYESDDKQRSTAWLDATYTGSVCRFFNHSCNFNAQLVEGICGMKHRIVYVETTRTIEIGEEITIDYGDKWFETPDKPCLCGTANCKNPPQSWSEVMDLDTYSSESEDSDNTD